jgi:hypothetical protein
LGIFSEISKILERLQEGFLDRVFGVLAVTRDGLRDSEKSAAVSLHELLEGSDITLLARVDKLQIVAYGLPRCELCRACSHIRHNISENNHFAGAKEPAKRGRPFPWHAL